MTMRRTMAAATALTLGLTGAALAQEASRDEAREEKPRPVRSIRVLQNPYDLASFYRAHEGGTFAPSEGGLVDPAYAIAGFYRSPQGGEALASPYGWSAFWTGGYAALRPAPLPGYRRSIGENGDLFLAVPFLAPVGPISGAFFGY
jgi:hypothetical protein